MNLVSGSWLAPWQRNASLTGIWLPGPSPIHFRPLPVFQNVFSPIPLTCPTPLLNSNKPSLLQRRLHMKLTAKHTIYSCYLGYITQAIVTICAPFVPHVPQPVRHLTGEDQPADHREFLHPDSHRFPGTGNHKKSGIPGSGNHILYCHHPWSYRLCLASFSSSQRLHRHPYLYGVQRSGRRYLGGYRKPHCGVLSQ